MSELNLESKSLIRKYLLTLFALPATILAIVGFLLGWFINDAARGQAYADAYGQAQSKILELTSSASVAAERATNAEVDAKEATVELNASLAGLAVISKKIEGYGSKLDTIEKAEQGLATEVAVELLKNPGNLTTVIAATFGDRLSSVESQGLKHEEIITLQESRLDSNIRFGSTPEGNTDWKLYNNAAGGVYVEIDTSAAGFKETPIYLVNLAGQTSHWTTKGGSSVYSPSPTNFRVYIQQENITAVQANEWGWVVNWVGIGG